MVISKPHVGCERPTDRADPRQVHSLTFDYNYGPFTRESLIV